MTNVFYFGSEEYSPNVQTYHNKHHILKSVKFVIPSTDPPGGIENEIKQMEQELCFTQVMCSAKTTLLFDCNILKQKFEDQNELWGFGYSGHRILGYEQQNQRQPVNLSTILRQKITKMSIGSQHIIVYTGTKRLFAWGDQSHHRLGQISEMITKTERFNAEDPDAIEVDLEFKLNIYDITLQLQEKDKKITNSSKIQLTQESENSQQSRSVENNPIFGKRQLAQQSKRKSDQSFAIDVIGLTSCNERTYIILPKKVVFQGQSCYKTSTPYHEIKEFNRVKVSGISCGPTHSIAWSQDGRVWTWGDHSDGKLGYMVFGTRDNQFTASQIQHTPKILDKISHLKIIQAVCGSNYSIALDIHGDVYEWGKGPASFNLELIQAIEPKKLEVKSSSIVKIGAGLNHYGMLDIQGRLYLWGSKYSNMIDYSSNGSLGHIYADSRLPQRVQSLSNIKVIDFSIGSHFTVVIASSNPNYKLKQVNVENYKKCQIQRISEEVHQIRDYLKRKIQIIEDNPQPGYSPISNQIKKQLRVDLQAEALQGESMMILELEEEERKSPQSKNKGKQSLAHISQSLVTSRYPKISLISPIKTNAINSLKLFELQPQLSRHKNTELSSARNQLSFTSLTKQKDQDQQSSDTNQITLKKYTKDVQFNVNEDGKSYASIQFDPIVSQMLSLEKKSPLFLPVINNEKKSQHFTANALKVSTIDTNQNIEELIDSKNDILKFQYIQMIKEGDEQGHMMYLLSDTGVNSEEIFENYKFKVKQEERLKNMKILQRDQFKLVNKDIKDVGKFDIKKMKDQIARIITRVKRFDEVKLENTGRSLKYFSKEEISQHFKTEGIRKKAQTQENQVRRLKLMEDKYFIQTHMIEQHHIYVHKEIKVLSIGSNQKKKVY